MIEYVFVAIALLGSGLVSLGKPLQANYMWGVSNPCLVWYNYTMGDSAQSILFGALTLISWIGIINLRRKLNGR